MGPQEAKYEACLISPMGRSVVGAHTFSPRTWGAEAARPLSLRAAWCTEQEPGNPRPHKETLSLKTKINNLIKRPMGSRLGGLIPLPHLKPCKIRFRAFFKGLGYVTLCAHHSPPASVFGPLPFPQLSYCEGRGSVPRTSLARAPLTPRRKPQRPRRCPTAAASVYM